MKLYRLECINQDGDYEINGYFIFKENAEKMKAEMDLYGGNKRYDIKQNIVEIETED